MIGKRFLHLKRGTKYEVNGRAKMQISIATLMRLVPDTMNIAQAAAVCAALERITFIDYQSVDDESLYVRPESEFMDGRFKDITPVRGWVLRKVDYANSGHEWVTYYKVGVSKNECWVRSKDDATLYSEPGFAYRDLSNAFPMHERAKITVIETEREPK